MDVREAVTYHISPFFAYKARTFVAVSSRDMTGHTKENVTTTRRLDRCLEGTLFYLNNDKVEIGRHTKRTWASVSCVGHLGCRLPRRSLPRSSRSVLEDSRIYRRHSRGDGSNVSQIVVIAVVVAADYYCYHY